MLIAGLPPCSLLSELLPLLSALLFVFVFSLLASAAEAAAAVAAAMVAVTTKMHACVVYDVQYGNRCKGGVIAGSLEIDSWSPSQL